MTPETRAARERKQKIFVVVGGLFLVAMLAFQLPKLLGGSSPAEAAPAGQTTTSQGQVTPAPAGVATAVVSRTPMATTTKLTSFTAFRQKDPFVQQVVTQNGIESAGPPAAAGQAVGKAAETGKPTKFTTGAKAAAATIVTVNGTRQVLEPGTKFPAGDPLFVLVAEKPGAKAVVVGIVGGAYSGGDNTTTLKVGKPLTLVNTTTGARYKLSLVSVGSGDQAEQQPAKQ
jgi:hypothetical protein